MKINPIFKGSVNVITINENNNLTSVRKVKEIQTSKEEDAQLQLFLSSLANPTKADKISNLKRKFIFGDFKCSNKATYVRPLQNYLTNEENVYASVLKTFFQCLLLEPMIYSGQLDTLIKLEDNHWQISATKHNNDTKKFSRVTTIWDYKA